MEIILQGLVIAQILGFAQLLRNGSFSDSKFENSSFGYNHISDHVGSFRIAWVHVACERNVHRRLLFGTWTYLNWWKIQSHCQQWHSLLHSESSETLAPWLYLALDRIGATAQNHLIERFSWWMMPTWSHSGVSPILMTRRGLSSPPQQEFESTQGEPSYLNWWKVQTSFLRATGMHANAVTVGVTVQQCPRPVVNTCAASGNNKSLLFGLKWKDVE